MLWGHICSSTWRLADRIGRLRHSCMGGLTTVKESEE